MTDRTLRRGQTLSPFGVGAIVDIVGESFVAMDTTWWKGGRLVYAPRIAASFGVAELKAAPPNAGSGGHRGAPGIPYERFPRALFCPSCRRITRWSFRDEEPGAAARCKRCRKRSQLVPMRFVMICGRGHMEDVPWKRWAHSKATSREQRQCATDELRFITRKGVGGGLQSLIIRCEACGAERDLKGIASKDAPAQMGVRCGGLQPWQPFKDREECPADLAVVQRGASNVHYPLVRSALDIPPYSDFDQYASKTSEIQNDQNFKALEANPDHPLREGLLGILAGEHGVGRTYIEAVLRGVSDDTGAEGGGEASEEHVRREEWTALVTVRDRKPHPKDRFVVEVQQFGVERAGTALDVLAGLLATLTVAHRLREVRALVGFNRYDMQRIVRPDLTGRLDWLPAIEVFGEGLFLSLDEQALGIWENDASVVARVSRLADQLNGSTWSRFLDAPTPRGVLVHTLSHLLIRQLIYESGYSSASLRERLYVAQGAGTSPMAGVLVYTGEGDAEGTLGGLARAGQPSSLLPTLLTALRNASWCSLDPVCRESSGQGPDSLSLAACHACALVAETSCESANVLLDRALLVDPRIGFFRAVLDASDSETGAGL